MSKHHHIRTAKALAREHHKGLVATHFYNPKTKRIELIGSVREKPGRLRRTYSLAPVSSAEVRKRILEGKLRHPYGARR
jgi:hypothetical protein